MADGTDYTFVCPECAESMVVNGPMRDALIENGCVVCSSSVSSAAFSQS